MRTSTFRALSFVLLGSSVLTAQTRMLYDGRIDPLPPTSQAPLPAALQKRLLSAMFPKYLTRPAECDARNLDLAARRKAGQIVPNIGAGTVGSFTAMGSHQRAYLVTVGECGEDSRIYDGTFRLAIFAGDRLVVNLEVPGDHIAATADLNGDGVDAILIERCGFGTGTLTCGASLVSVAGGRLDTLKEFPIVYEDPCGFSKDMPVIAKTIRYTPGRSPRLVEEEYRAGCPGNGQEPKFERARPLNQPGVKW